MSRTRAPAARLPGTVALVGAGPGEPGLLTVAGADRLAAADVVVTDATAPPELLARCRPGVEILQAAGDPTEDVKTLAQHARVGSRVVRLLPGDPFVGGPGAAEAEGLARARVRFEVVPGVSAAVAIPEYAGVPLTSPNGPADFAVVTTGAGQVTDDWAALAAGPRTLVVLGEAPGIGKVAGRLVEHGRRGDTPIAVTVSGGTPHQVTVASTLDRVESDANAAGLAGRVVAVVGDAVRARERLSWFETRPLFGWKVLVPRTKEQAGPVSGHLRALGAIPIEVPTIAVEPPRTPAAMDRAIKGLVSGRYQWIAFTSTNAVKAVREKLEEVGLDARAFAGVKVAAIGEATAAALLAFGIRPELVPSGEQSSEGLLADWAPHDEVFDPIDRVFLPRADIATDTLVAGLKERGWEVDDVTAYRTVRAAPPPAEIREALKGGGFDAVLFTSSSTARNLVGIAGKPHDTTVLACIGPATTAAAEELGLRVDVVAPVASVSALVEALAAHALERRAAAGGAYARPSLRRSRAGRTRKTAP